MRIYETIIFDFLRCVVRCCLWCMAQFVQRHKNRHDLKLLPPAGRHDDPDPKQDD